MNHCLGKIHRQRRNTAISVDDLLEKMFPILPSGEKAVYSNGLAVFFADKKALPDYLFITEGGINMRFFSEKKRSAGYARDRMKLLLVSERIDCSPQMMKLLRNDLIHTVKKYVVIDETRVTIQISQEPPVLHAVIPVLKKRDA